MSHDSTHVIYTPPKPYMAGKHTDMQVFCLWAETLADAKRGLFTKLTLATTVLEVSLWSTSQKSGAPVRSGVASSNQNYA